MATPSDTLARLLACGPEIETDAWSLGDAALRSVLAEVGPRGSTIVECGSGRSTIVIARRLREIGRGHLLSLEHDPAWAELTTARLAAETLGDRATVIAAPLTPHPLAGEAGRWYSPKALSSLPKAGIELLLIDGPPAGEADLQLSRHPALGELGPRLAPGATVILDDAQRPGERLAIERWSARFGITFALDPASGTAKATWRV